MLLVFFWSESLFLLLDSAQVFLQDFRSIIKMGLWLPGSLVQRVPLPEYKVMPSGTLSLMPQYTLDVILQRPFHQLRRWWLNLPNEFI